MGSKGVRSRRRSIQLVIGVLMVSAWCLCLFTGQAHAQGGVRRPLAPSLYGSQGLFRTVSAEILPVGSISLGLHGEFFQASGFAFPNTDTERLIGDLAISWSTYHFEAFDQPFYTEVSLAWSGSAVFFDGAGSGIFPPPPDLIQVSLFNLYFKVARTIVSEDEKEPLSYGIGLGVFLPSKVDEIGVDFGQTSAQIDGLVTYDLAAGNEDLPPLRFHGNVGFFANNVSKTEGFFPVNNPANDDSNAILRFAMGQSVFNQLRIRLGAEYVHRRFTPFLEWNMDALLEFPQNVSFFDSPQRFTPGIRIRPAPSWNFSLGVEIALAQAADPEVSVLPDWNLIFGLAYTHIPTPPPPPPPLIEPKERPVAIVTTGKITGVVYDANTNAPVGMAIISFPGRDLTALLTDAETGAYTTYDLPAGPVDLEAEKEGYLSRTATPVVVAGQTVTQDFYLVPEVVELQRGTFRGTVQSEDGEFLKGLVSLFGLEDRRETEAGVGTFLFELGPGDYRATAEAEGYFPATHLFTLQAGEVVIHDFVLKKKPEIKKKKFVELTKERIEISENIYFATGKATVLEQSFPVLREVADVIKENPQIQLVEVGGHTDSRGKDEYNKKLSERRANSVRQFLVNEGVEPARLTAVGYGEEVPLVFPDDSAEKQARNRRVEFVILKQQAP